MSQISPPPYQGPSGTSPVEPHRGTVILVLGILSLVVCQPLGIAAWLMGNTDIRKMQMGTMDRSGEGMTQAGRICGIIGTILCAISVVLIVLYLVIIMIVAGGAAMSH